MARKIMLSNHLSKVAAGLTEQQNTVKNITPRQRAKLKYYQRQGIDAGLSYDEVTQLNSAQVQGRIIGLSRQQVENNWFADAHCKAAQAGIDYQSYQELTQAQVSYGILIGLTREQVEGLSHYQLRGMRCGLTHQQVNHSWFDKPHYEAAAANSPYEDYQGLNYPEARGYIYHKLTRAQMANLNHYQIQGMAHGLTRQKVEHDWFGEAHCVAAHRGLPYQEYQGLTQIQVKFGICKGLTREEVLRLSDFQLLRKATNLPNQQLTNLNDSQVLGILNGLTFAEVNHPWFAREHCLAAEDLIPYYSYKGLTQRQTRLIRNGATREEALCFNDFQQRGLDAALEPQHVLNYWFGEAHCLAAEAKIPYEDYRELTRAQVEQGILQGLTREQVLGLEYCQIQAIRIGLTREQVNHAWFKSGHCRAAKIGLPYEIYQGLTQSQVMCCIRDRLLTREQVLSLDDFLSLEMATGFAHIQARALTHYQRRGMATGLTPAQVNPGWFDSEHCLAAEAGFPYDSYRGLTNTEIKHGIRKGLSREQVINLKGDQLACVEKNNLPDATMMATANTEEQMMAVVQSFKKEQKRMLAKMNFFRPSSVQLPTEILEKIATFF